MEEGPTKSVLIAKTVSDLIGNAGELAEMVLIWILWSTQVLHLKQYLNS